MISNNNGVGPTWFPSWLRQQITIFSLIFFKETSWIKHDDAYTIGGSKKDRQIADELFLLDLKQDLKTKNIVLQFFGILIAYFYYYTLRLFGSSAYYYTKGE